MVVFEGDLATQIHDLCKVHNELLLGVDTPILPVRSHLVDLVRSLAFL